MFNSITGTLTYKGTDVIYLQAGSIEWEIYIPAISISGLPATGSEIRIFTHLHHKEDQMKIFGFHSLEQRSLFLDLVKVSGVGPKQATRILSGMNTEHLVLALDNGDIDTLTRLPGLGKKTAQKIVLALRGKLSYGSGKSEESLHPEILDALVDMGFDRKGSIKALNLAETELKDDILDKEAKEKELFRRAIVFLSS